MRIFVLLSAFLIALLLLAAMTNSSTAKSYSLQSLSSEIYIRNGDCSLKIVEYFQYEFNGTFSRIGRALPPLASNAYDRSVTLVSDNGYNIRSEYQKISESPYVVLYLEPSTPENGITVLSFKLSYTISGSNSFFQTESQKAYQVSYYYKDNYKILNLNSTFIFDSTIDFSNPPTPDSNGILTLNSNQQYSIFYQKSNLISQYTPSVTFRTNSNQYDKCLIDQSAINAAIILSVIGGTFLLTGLILFCVLRNRKGGGGGGNGGDGSGGNYSSFNDTNYTTSNDFGGGGGGGGGGSSSHGGSGFAD
ncbi:predicted protein [Naegleria gruberi]|uniref:Predicted protein n=1 Tax=Naegleria gruberi TaxID=5762 RepID=D2VWW7_NAEGR|nr:uncharacterized protein NAEGRDRAFT_73530 [Naegleria gruberi]EFC38761.1 predicted protein [Naegleria gruberi]|eukprot:XP_002671505.1 predicted protein [Naegleria gruberi strain NEG-M]